MDEFYRTLGQLEIETAPLEPGSEARIARRVMHAVGRRRKKRRIVLLAVAAAVLLTACTAVAVNYKDWFRLVYSPGSEEVTEELFSDMGMTIGETVTDPETGVSLTLDGGVYDGERMALALTVHGVEMDEETLASLYYVGLADVSASLISLDRVERLEQYADEAGLSEEERQQIGLDPAQELVEVYLYVSEQEKDVLHLEVLVPDVSSRSGDRMELQMENIIYHDVLLAEGSWTFTFTLPEQTVGKLYQGAVTVAVPGGKMEISSVTVRPSRVEIECSAPAPGDSEEKLQPKRVRLKDGRTFGFSGVTLRTILEDEEGDSGTITYMMGAYAHWQFISPEDVEAVCIGEDTWIELAQLQAVPLEDAAQ